MKRRTVLILTFLGYPPKFPFTSVLRKIRKRTGRVEKRLACLQFTQRECRILSIHGTFFFNSIGIPFSGFPQNSEIFFFSILNFH